MKRTRKTNSGLALHQMCHQAGAYDFHRISVADNRLFVDLRDVDAYVEKRVAARLAELVQEQKV